MLNDKGQRELAYVIKIDRIEPIQGSDNCEAAYVGGWHVMVKKGEFRPGDLAVYFEIDSHLDINREEFSFLEKRHGNVKTQKYTFGGKGNFISQGLLMSFEDFGWGKDAFKEGDFLTETLGVKYYEPEDNKRKESVDKYTKMYFRHKKLFKNKFLKWLYSKQWGKKILFVFLGKSKKKRNDWPEWVKKTDEERIQNMPWMFPGDPGVAWIATEKIDGTSTTFTVKGFGRKRVFKVCSRNVCFDTETPKKCYYDDTGVGNVYLEMAQKYNAKEVMSNWLDEHRKAGWEYLTIQGETFGEGIQKRSYIKGHDMRVFNVILGDESGVQIRLDPWRGKEFAEALGFEFVPILGGIVIPETCEELMQKAKEKGSGKSEIDGGMREGIVCRSYDGQQSFKVVDNDYLLKYHN